MEEERKGKESGRGSGELRDGWWVTTAVCSRATGEGVRAPWLHLP